MVSAWFLYIIFMLYVPSFRVILTRRILTCNVLFAWTHYALYHAKKNPGIITRSPNNTHNTPTETYSTDIKDSYSKQNNGQSPDFSSSHSHDAFTDEDAPNDDTSQVSYVKYRGRTTLHCQSARSIGFLSDTFFLDREIWCRGSSVD